MLRRSPNSSGLQSDLAPRVRLRLAPHPSAPSASGHVESPPLPSPKNLRPVFSPLSTRTAPSSCCCCSRSSCRA
ncbi:hypothetical protein ZEAMMB73_Zm00001d051709 [Zea mays]|uniref:Uncharacterized protein n=1 Tax=Zea mays TaxID=4577 RepID=A0A1D6Q9H3_MAIZE|nr:hypothetical protein ZEAMMB73_Zm00001d051709 [Zea mays]AQK55021.1 hypothetical protein ZEAMMB73_Zm00001d051709 [Zea mays]